MVVGEPGPATAQCTPFLQLLTNGHTHHDSHFLFRTSFHFLYTIQYCKEESRTGDEGQQGGRKGGKEEKQRERRAGQEGIQDSGHDGEIQERREGVRIGEND